MPTVKVVLFALVIVGGAKKAFRTDSVMLSEPLLEAAAIITAGADVEVLSGREAQTGQGPVAAGRRAVAQGV